MAGMMQQPSRSLWIGNFDPSTTAQELMNVFAVYGPIESLRLLPDKVGFYPSSRLRYDC
jgi:protein JSN1